MPDGYEFLSKNGVSKAERYGWMGLDLPGEFRLVPKNILNVDDEYQRDAEENRTKVLAIAREFSWAVFGVLIVALRLDGTLFVYDGGHRLLAARHRSDVDLVPCLIFRIASREDEARLFDKINRYRKAMAARWTHRALAFAGDDVARCAAKLVLDAGRVIGRSDSAKEVRCISTITKWVKKDRDALTRVWPLITRLCAGRPIHNRIIEGMMYAERYMPPGESLMDARWRNRIINAGYDEILNRMASFAAAYKSGGERVYACGLVEAINKGLQKRLVLREPTNPNAP
jgi:hypothetical protein